MFSKCKTLSTLSALLLAINSVGRADACISSYTARCCSCTSRSTRKSGDDEVSDFSIEDDLTWCPQGGPDMVGSGSLSETMNLSRDMHHARERSTSRTPVALWRAYLDAADPHSEDVDRAFSVVGEKLAEAGFNQLQALSGTVITSIPFAGFPKTTDAASTDDYYLASPADADNFENFEWVVVGRDFNQRFDNRENAANLPTYYIFPNYRQSPNNRPGHVSKLPPDYTDVGNDVGK